MHVFGINALKTVDPPPSDLAGEVVSDVRILDSTTLGLEITFLHHTLTIDLARTGLPVLLDVAQPWAPSGRPSPPTGRLIFGDGTGVDFKEPAKTKRITFSILHR